MLNPSFRVTHFYERYQTLTKKYVPRREQGGLFHRPHISTLLCRTAPNTYHSYLLGLTDAQLSLTDASCACPGLAIAGLGLWNGSWFLF